MAKKEVDLAGLLDSDYEAPKHQPGATKRLSLVLDMGTYKALKQRALDDDTTGQEIMARAVKEFLK